MKPPSMKTTIKAVMMLVLCLSILLPAAGCGESENRKLPGYLYVRLKKNPTTLDPALVFDVDGMRLATKLFNGLVGFDESLTPVPDLAHSWTISPDGRTYLFQLKKGIRFFNGREITAADVVYSFKRVLDPKTRSPRTWVLSRIKGSEDFRQGRADHVAGLRANNAYELEITLAQPFAPFLCMLGLPQAFVVPREEVDRWGPDYAFHAGGSGPFTLEQWHPNQFVLLKANRHYRGPQRPLAGIYYRIIPEDFTAMVAFEKGELDLLPEIMASEYGRYARDSARRLYIQYTPSLNTYYLGLNCQKPPFNDPRVRRALNLAIDREKILTTLMDKRGIVARGPLPPLMRRHPPPRGYPYSPQSAKELLRQAGYPRGFSMTIYQTADRENLDICQAIQDYLKQVGIKADIVQLEWSTFLAAVSSGEAQAFWLSWWADYPDQENFLFPTFHSQNWGPGGNRSRFHDETIDRLIGRAVGIMDTHERRAVYADIEQRIVDAAPWVFFWHKAICGIRQPWVKGYRPAPLPVMEKGVGIHIDEVRRER